MSLNVNPRITLDEATKDFYLRCAIPVIPRNGMYLRCFDGDGQRFKRLLREAWKALPLEARRRLLKHWRDCGPVNVISPEFELVAGWSRQDGRTFGACFQLGHTFRFWSRAIEVMPDQIVTLVICHEFGHAYLAALGLKCERTAEEWNEYYAGGAAYAYDDEEIAVRDLLGCWGLDDGEVDSWADRNRALLDRLKNDWDSPRSPKDRKARSALSPVPTGLPHGTRIGAEVTG